jgi:biopolymer transport protein ExbB/TolQ
LIERRTIFAPKSMIDATAELPEEVPLAWSRKDVEQRLFFTGGRHTRVNAVLTMMLGLGATVAFYAILVPFDGSYYADMFTKRSWVQYATVLLSFWSLAILLVKGRKLAFQRRALDYAIAPRDSDFVLSASNVDQVTDRIYQICDDPRNFVLYNRIVVALANLRNLGRIGDVGDILRAQAESDEAASETSYALVSGFVWAIPVLGFIGTVLGLSEAIGSFSAVLEQSEDMSQIKDSLRSVTGGLATAFETTLVALVAALAIQLLLTFLKKSEQEFLDDCAEYSTNQVVNHLRILPYERVDVGK